MYRIKNYSNSDLSTIKRNKPKTKNFHTYFKDIPSILNKKYAYAASE